MAVIRKGSCSCGQFTITCEGEPVRVGICHCLACQKRSGSAFAVQARWLKERVQVAGESKEWSRTGDEGGVGTFRFCPTCSAIVYYTNEGMPELIAVPIGILGDPTLPPPRYSVYEARKHPWVILPDGIEHLD